MIRTLWLCSWYPNVEKKQNGDFVQRLAQATSLYAKVDTIAVERSNQRQNSITKPILYPQLTENIILYTSPKFPVLGKIISNIKYLYYHFSIIKKYCKKYGKPDIIHVQVAFKAGIIALIYKRAFNIPYCITEHWTQYLSIATENYRNRSILYKYLNKLIFKNAEKVISVGDQLKESLDSLMGVNAIVIPNVVNTQVFQYEKIEKNRNFNYIHISSMASQKNPLAILETFVAILKEFPESQLKMVGAYIPEISKYSHIPEIQFLGNKEYEQIPYLLNRSDACIIFSAYETCCCVIQESLTMGIPVISTKVGIAPKIIVPNENGYLIENDQADLYDTMKNIRNLSVDNESIAKGASSQFDYNTIGKKYIDLYTKILKTCK